MLKCFKNDNKYHLKSYNYLIKKGIRGGDIHAVVAGFHDGLVVLLGCFLTKAHGVQVELVHHVLGVLVQHGHAAGGQAGNKYNYETLHSKQTSQLTN